LGFVYRGEFKPYWARAPKMSGRAMAALEQWGLVEYKIIMLGKARLARLTPRGMEVRDKYHRRVARKKSEEPLL
jgi:hypothetical protein